MRATHDSTCIKDEPGLPLYIVIGLCFVVFGGSAIGFVVWLFHGH
jgi:hypothetical protein